MINKSNFSQTDLFMGSAIKAFFIFRPSPKTNTQTYNTHLYRRILMRTKRKKSATKKHINDTTSINHKDKKGPVLTHSQINDKSDIPRSEFICTLICILQTKRFENPSKYLRGPYTPSTNEIRND